MEENATNVTSTKKLSKLAKILILIGGITFAVLLCIYLGFSIYFNNHYFFSTKINDLNCYGKTPTQVEKLVKSNLEQYKLTIEERNSTNEEITAADVKMKAVLDTDMKDLKKKQNPLAWPSSLFKKHTYNIDVSLDYDEQLLNSKIQSLTCLQDANMKAFTNASIAYNKGSYEIVPEDKGTTLDKEKTIKAITNAINDVKTTITLDDSDCYLNPTILSTDENINKAVSTLNNYLKTNLTYNILGNTEVINKDTIQPWLNWNENFDVNIDESSVLAKVSEWSNAYNTAGKSRTFHSTYGTDVTIAKGNYGWKINPNETTSQLIASIQAGESASKEPVYKQKAASTDITKDYGNTYVEINLGSQHLYYYKEGKLIVESDFVSGKVTTGCATPTGVYGITYKQSPAVLKGDNYSSPVTYWMPFNGGIGLHDASWRHGKFGGNIYYNAGSHGCINLPTSTAKTIYENISAGTAVIVYDLKTGQSTTSTTASDSALTPEEQTATETEQEPTNTQSSDINNLTVETPAPNVATPADTTPANTTTDTTATTTDTTTTDTTANNDQAAQTASGAATN